MLEVREGTMTKASRREVSNRGAGTVRQSKTRQQEHDRQAPDNEFLFEESQHLVKIFAAYGIEGSISEVVPGPVVVSYEFIPSLGTRMSQIAELASDLTMALAPRLVRITAPIQRKFAVRVEVVNDQGE